MSSLKLRIQSTGTRQHYNDPKIVIITIYVLPLSHNNANTESEIDLQSTKKDFSIKYTYFGQDPQRFGQVYFFRFPKPNVTSQCFDLNGVLISCTKIELTFKLQV